MATATKTRSTKTTDSDVFDRLTSQVLDMMENNPGQWTKPWSDALAGGSAPYSIGTGNQYTGGNVWICLTEQIINGWDHAWGTYNQWAEFLGAERKGKGWALDRTVVRKGEKATYILRPQVVEIRKDSEGNPLPPAERKKWVKFYPMAIFNAAQVEGAMDKLNAERPKAAEFDPIEAAEKFIANTKATISFGGTDAYYTPKLDQIHLPIPGSFRSPVDFYATAVHELGHWTGHRSRLNRPGVTHFEGFQSESYAKEELVAELTAVFVGSGVLGLSSDPRPDHAKYLAHWVAKLKEDPKYFWRAASEAQAATKHLVGLQAGE